MEHISTLKHYKLLRHAGYTDVMAEAAVNALNESFDGVATKEDLKSLEKDIKDLEKNLEIRIDSKLSVIEGRIEAKMDSKFSTINIIGSAIFLVVCLPLLQKLISLIPELAQKLIK